MTKGQLYNYHMQLQQWGQQDNVMGHLFKGRIRDFYKENGIIIDGILDSIRTIQEAHLVIEDGKVVMQGEGEAQTPTWKEGKTKEMFDAEWVRLMQMPAILKYKPQEAPMTVVKDEPAEEQKEGAVAPVTEGKNG